MSQMPYKKKLIEVAMPLEAINRAAVREKMIRHGHPSTFHLWWARRPLATCRAAIFAQLIDDPSEYPEKFKTTSEQNKERQRLFELIEKLVVWENSTDEEILTKAKHEILTSCDNKMPAVVDPFSGGASIPLEAKRLGLPSYGGDLNPVATLIGKALVELPSDFVNREPLHSGPNEKLQYHKYDGLKEDVLWYGKVLSEQCNKKISQFYPKIKNDRDEMTVMCWMWARTVESPDPAFQGIHVPLISTFWLSRKNGRKAWVEPIVYGNSYEFKVNNCEPPKDIDVSNGTKAGRGANFICILSKSAIQADYIKSEGKAGRLGWKLLAIVAEGPNGRTYLSPDIEHEKIAFQVPASWKPDAPLSQHPQYMSVTNFGPKEIGDLFMPRQLFALNTFFDEIDNVLESVPNEKYRDILKIYLALSVSRLANRQSTSTFWDTGREAVQGVFAMQALPMRWETAEGNPFSKSSGNFIGCVEYLCKNFDFLPMSEEAAEVKQIDARHFDYSNKVVVTDPPYYDNVPYADLSDFFYVWLRKSLKNTLPELFDGILVPKSDELVADHQRKNGKKEADVYFINGMTEVMSNIVENSSEDFPISIFYAFKQSQIDTDGESSVGWATFLEAVISSGLSINATWPVRTELVGALKKVKNVLATSVILVCRKRNTSIGTITRAEFIRQLKTELPKAISELRAANISPADIPQSSIGPGIGIFSRYQAVLEPDDTPMSVKSALQLINRELGDEEGEYDAETSFALTWFEQLGFNVGEFGTANNIANAKGIAVNALEHAGIASTAGGKFNLRNRESLEEGWDPTKDTNVTIWECCQYLIRRMENRGEFEAAKLMKQMGQDRAESAKELAYALYDIAANKLNDATEATAYNGLISAWSELTLQAANITEADIRGDGQGTLL